MEELFGDTLVKYREIPEQELKEYQEAKANYVEGAPFPEEPKPYQYFETSEAIAKTTKFIGILFSAHYCPPCKKFL